MSSEILGKVEGRTHELLSSIEEIINRYNIGNIIELPKQLSGGSVHNMWYIATSTGQYAIKKVNLSNCALLENTILPVNQAENLALHYLQQGISTRVALRSSNNQLMERCQKNESWMVFPWIEGGIKTPPQITAADAQKIAPLLMEIMGLAPEISALKIPNWFGFKPEHWEYLIRAAEKYSLKWAPIARARQSLLIDWSDAASKVAPILQKNLVLSHRDLSFSNIVWTPDFQPVVIDWEYAGLVNPESEIFNTAMTWAYQGEDQFDLNIFNAFIDATQFSFTLDNTTLKAAYAGYLLEWCEFNMQRSFHKSTTNISSSAHIASVLRILSAI